MARQQREFRFRTHGGRRAGAGRKPAGDRAGVPHRARRFTSAKHPQHVTLKVRSDLPGLRRRWVWQAIAWALAITVRRDDFRTIHLSIQGNHIHLIVEADTPRGLARGMQGFQISVAKQINARLGRRGRVFADRFHARVLDRPTTVRSALNYVLNNWRHHGYDRGVRRAVDPYSTAYVFEGWAERQTPFIRWDRSLLPVSYPTTWLLTTGWKRGGGLLSIHEVPG